MGKFLTVQEAQDENKPKKETATLTSLYEVKNVVNIGDIDSTENVDPLVSHTLPEIQTASNHSWLALAVDSDVSIYNISVDCVYEVSHSINDGIICGLVWLGEHHVLAIFTSYRHFILLSPRNGVLCDVSLDSEKHSHTSATSAIVSASEIGNQCLVTIVDNGGNIYTVTFSNWNPIVNLDDSEQSRDFIEKIISNIDIRVSESEHEIVDMLSSASILSTISSTKNSHDFLVTAFKPAISDNLQTIFADQNYHLTGEFVRIREACNGRYLVGLTSSGELVIHDLWTLFHLTNGKPININISKEATVLDFFFIQSVKYEFSFENVALIVQKHRHYFIEIVSLSDGNVLYSLEVEEKTKFIKDADSSQRIMFFVEYINNGLGVSLNQILESHPDKKLTRLIEQNRLDEAEKFAKQFGLDCQKVYISQMDILFEKACDDDSSEIFKDFISSLDKVTDHNRVAETCFSGAATFTNFERVQTLLQYAGKRNISDKDCLQRLNDVSYVFATYRMIVKPDKANFSHWPLFVEGADGPGHWLILFYEYVMAGQISEARIIFHRHKKYVSSGIILDLDTNDECIFLKIRSVFIERINVWHEMMDLLEYDIIPDLIPKCDDETKMISGVVDFLLYAASTLEKFDPTNFPQNSLHVTLLLERTCKLITENCVTPAKQALLALFGRAYYDADSRAQELITYSENLKAIQRLKDVYQCHLSYTTYCSLDPERICYHILQAAVENPSQVATRIEKYARPYMNEHCLDPDRTIFRYIEEVSRKALLVVSSASPWHEYCLLVSETIQNYTLKCQAITIIAKSIQPPWPKKLSVLVDTILSSYDTEDELKKQLQRVYHRAELGRILQSHNVNFNLMDSIIANEKQFARYMMYMMHQDYPLETLIQSSIKAVKLYQKLNNHLSQNINNTAVYYFVASQLLHTSGIDTMISYVDNLANVEEAIQEEVVESLIQKLALEINADIDFMDEKYSTERLQLLYAIEGLIQRYRSNDSTMLELYEDIITLRKFQERYGKWITVSNLHDDEWKIEKFLKYLAESNRELPEIFAFANALHLKPDISRIHVLQFVMSRTDLFVVSHVLRDSVLAIKNPSNKLIEMYIRSCEFIFNELPRVCNSQSDTEIFDNVVELIYRMARILSELTFSTARLNKYLEKMLHMEHYIRLFLFTIEQFVSEDSPITENRGDQSGENRILGFSKRLSVYQIMNDGPIMNQTEIIALLCAVAPSVTIDYKDERGDNINAIYNAWDDLCNSLAINHQDILIYGFRVYSSYLPCFYGLQNELHIQLRESAKKICEKTIQSHPCDLWSSCAALMCLTPQEAGELAMELRQGVALRRSPQTMINYLRVMQTIVICLYQTKYFETLKRSFVQSLWRKRLAKVGSSAKGMSPDQPLFSDLEDFAKKKLDPLMVSEFLSEFRPQLVDDQMLNYAITLVSKASEAESRAYRLIADNAMKMCNSPRNHVYWRCRRAMYTLCPYNYEPIHFLLEIMTDCVRKGGVESMSDIDNQEPITFIDSCHSILEFLVRHKRNGQITKEEITWYMQYQKIWQADLKEYGNKDCDRKNVDCFGTRLSAWFDDGALDGESIAYNDKGLKYERADRTGASLPSKAVQSLPFHLFLFRLKDDVVKWLVPVVEAEVNLSTVTVWKAVAGCVRWLKTNLPRQKFLLHAVMKRIDECITKGLSLEPVDEHLLMEILTKHSSPEDVSSCITHCTKNLKLSEPKIQLLKIGITVTQGWLSGSTFSQEQLTDIADAQQRYIELLKNYKTELLLKKEGMYDNKSSELVEIPSELVCYIYSSCIDWTSKIDIERKSKLVVELTHINDVNLSEIQTDLVFRSLLEGEKPSDNLAVNLDDTMGLGMPVMDTGMSTEENDLIILPIFDVSTEKIVHLLKQLDYCSLFPKIRSQYITSDISSVAGGYKTIVRACCVLLRTYSDEDMKRLGGLPDKLCQMIETVLYTRLFEVARVDMQFDTFVRQSKAAIVKALMGPTKRHTPEQCILAASIIVDQELEEKSIIELLLNKLCIARKKEVCFALLRFCRDTPILCSVKNLGITWPRLVDVTTLPDLERSILHSWLYFLISCPVEIKGVESIKTLSSKLPVAATILAIASDFVKTIPSFSTHVQAGYATKDIALPWYSETNIMCKQEEDDFMEF